MSALALFVFAAPAYAQLKPSVPVPEFAERRAKVLKALGKDGLLVLRGAPEDDVEKHERWRQHSDFFYLTGFDEPDSVLVLNPRAPEPVILYVPPHNPGKEAWDGVKTSPGAEAEQRTGIGSVRPMTVLREQFQQWLSRDTTLYLDAPVDDPNAAVSPELQWLRDLRAGWAKAGVERRVAVQHCRALIHPLRLVKSPAEIAVFEQACVITGRGIVEAMRSIAPGQNEREAQAVVEYVFRRLGAARTGYPSIVGAGPNSCILHYRRNEGPMRDGDVVLMDVGAEFNYYTADITRTVPVNGRFSPAQREIYELVLKAQEAAFAQCKPGSTLLQVHRAAQQVFRDAGWGKYYLHGTSHWIGIDVHDVGGTWKTPLAPGMIFSVEPGLYIPEGTEGIDPKYWNIGIRIEDDVVITPSGYRNLSASVPRDIATIEAIMAGRGIGDAEVGRIPGTQAAPPAERTPAKDPVPPPAPPVPGTTFVGRVASVGNGTVELVRADDQSRITVTGLDLAAVRALVVGRSYRVEARDVNTVYVGDRLTIVRGSGTVAFTAP
ncbi:MAG: aminopeptidase P family protein [Planctomycetota bacterium]